MIRLDRIFLFCLTLGIFGTCSTESGYEMAVQVFQEHKDGNLLRAFRGYNLYKRGDSYHVFMPPNSARFVYSRVPGDSVSLRLVNEDVLRSAFPGVYDWADPTFLEQMTKKSRRLINTYDRMNVLNIDGRFRGGKYIKIYVTLSDALIYSPDNLEVDLHDFCSTTEKIVKLDRNWLYLRLRYPLDISG